MICALLVAAFIPEGIGVGSSLRTTSKRQSGEKILSFYSELLSILEVFIVSYNNLLDNSGVEVIQLA